MDGIAVAGSILVDRIHTISAYPECGQLTQIRAMEFATGGCVPNVAVDIKKIAPGLPVQAMGRIGDDGEGKLVCDTLTAAGVDISGVKICAGAQTSFTEVMSVEKGQRTFFTYPGTSAAFCCDDADFSQNMPRILHLGYFLLMDTMDNGDGVKLLQKAKAFGIATSIDLVSENSDRYSAVLPCLPYTDYLIINEYEAGMLTGIEPTAENLPAIAQKLMDMGVREKVILHMPAESLCLSKEGLTRAGSCILPENYICGTTGAGDAFCAGALVGIYEGRPDAEILDFAACCAAVSLRSADATSALTEAAQICALCSGFERRKIQ